MLVFTHIGRTFSCSTHWPRTVRITDMHLHLLQPVPHVCSKLPLRQREFLVLMPTSSSGSWSPPSVLLQPPGDLNRSHSCSKGLLWNAEGASVNGTCTSACGVAFFKNIVIACA